MLTKALRERQLLQQQELSEMEQSGRPDGASGAIEKQIKLGLAQAEQLLSQDTLT